MAAAIPVPPDKDPARRMARLARSAARGKITELEQALEARGASHRDHTGCPRAQPSSARPFI